MKKIIYFVFAAMALVACEPNNGATEKVRIGVSLDDKTQPYKGPQRISAIDGATEIDINWGEDDVLYYQLHGQPINTDNPFKIVSGVGKKQAFFECDAMIDYNDKFTLYYHGAAPTPNIANPIPQEQFITILMDGKTSINNDYLMYVATGCKVGYPIYLVPNYTLLGVMLTGDVTPNEGNFYIAIEDKNKEYVAEYMCKGQKIVDEKTANITLDAEKPVVYYIVLPKDYSLTNKLIRLVGTREKNPLSFGVSLEKITLDVGTAQMIALHVEEKTPEHDWDKYSLVN